MGPACSFQILLVRFQKVLKCVNLYVKTKSTNDNQKKSLKQLKGSKMTQKNPKIAEKGPRFSKKYQKDPKTCWAELKSIKTCKAQVKTWVSFWLSESLKDRPTDLRSHRKDIVCGAIFLHITSNFVPHYLIACQEDQFGHDP